MLPWDKSSRWLLVAAICVTSLAESFTQDVPSAHHVHRTHENPARLRHVRHMDNDAKFNFPPQAAALQSSPLRSGSATINAGGRLTVDDNHKPVFTDCANYAPSFKEERPPGTFVFKVEAFDKDPPEAGGRIVYSFVLSTSDQKKFNIDPNTGVITTKHNFDRDEPRREKTVYLTVRATDNGRPELDDVCTFKVNIIDVNDNRPVFDKVNYLESMPQDLAVGKEVMRISATDIDDGNNSLVHYQLDGPNYFKIDKTSGVIFLQKQVDKEPGYIFKLNATATDQGDPPDTSSSWLLPATINIEILVVESNKKAPTFTNVQPDRNPIVLPENRSKFDVPIITLDATSNIPNEPELQFVLLVGRTEQTNKQNMFVMESNGTRAYIKQGKSLDFETVSDYTLTIRVQNKYNLAAERVIFIKLEDVNDNIPAFTEVISGSVLENEPRGMPVMQVRAIDADGTDANNKVTYELADSHDLFQIDSQSGNITTLREFNREEKDFYNVKVLARDNSPSAIFNTGLPNQGEQVFRIEIADKNDNPPKFTKTVYHSDAIPEDANINEIVIEVRALDNDTASPVTYSIADGNVGDAFMIEPATGKIRVHKTLDYETLTRYTLKVRAFDGVFDDYAEVEITISDVNDNRPRFLPYKNNINITEESKVEGCIVSLEAYDPDIPDRSAPQHIHYFIVKEEQRGLLAINSDGCLMLKKPLDRDPPNGFATWQVHVGAKDEDGNTPTSLQETTEVVIHLEDINDNEPFLDMPQPVVWGENKPPGLITSLVAKDYDSDQNGPPFTFSLDPTASEEISTRFAITVAGLEARATFDREERKQYLIPVRISDSGVPSLTGTSTLTLEIGDDNDNPMKDGASSSFLYNYKGEAPDTKIGRVYVEDPDDWDLPDKTFAWRNGEHPQFRLDTDTGMITMLQGTADGTYMLDFTVVEAATRWFEEHSAHASVNVTVKELPEEAVTKSGSIRFFGVTAEQFVAPMEDGSPSRAWLLQSELSRLLNTSMDNVDVFTVLHSPKRDNQSLLDVRFSAHGSPYYSAVKLNRIISQNQDALSKRLSADVLMVGIDECLIENDLCGTQSCSNFLNVQSLPYAVFTNLTSFVGVRAVVEPLCICPAEPPTCLNGGTPVGETCECLPGYEGPRCEMLGVGFYGDGWALYPPFSACEESHLSLEVVVYKDNGLVFYTGPMRPNTLLGVTDFMALEVADGFPVLLLDYGSGTVRGESKAIRINDRKVHRIDITWSNTSIEMKVDSCGKAECLILKSPIGSNKFLNVNGPLQVGGALVDLKMVSAAFGWQHTPTNEGFHGCIRNLTYNAKTYNLGQPGDSLNADPGCSRQSPLGAAVSFGIDSNFLIAILVCAAILLLLLLAVVVHRRKTDDMYKDLDDIRENIITYEDEGGGEIDAGFDMNVLRLYDNDGQPMLKPEYLKDRHQECPDEVPDICGFLDGKKRVCDGDPEPGPLDDVRHYAYEGDGDSTGSLSSLASGTDEGDLDFDYLSDFGPRFRKLADMYGEQPSEDEGETVAAESWC